MPKLILVMGPQASGKTSKVAEFFDCPYHTYDNYEWIASDHYWPRNPYGKRYWVEERTSDGINFQIIEHDWGTIPILPEELAKAHRWAYGEFLKHLMDKRDIIYEGTFVTRKERKHVINDALEEDYEIQGIFIYPSLLTCALRNAERKDSVPDVILARTYAKLQLPDENEGFDKLEIIYK